MMAPDEINAKLQKYNSILSTVGISIIPYSISDNLYILCRGYCTTSMLYEGIDHIYKIALMIAGC